MPKGSPILTALSYYGITAFPGAATNPQIIAFFDAVKKGEIGSDETPWCSAFLNAVMEQCQYPVTNNLLAKSWLDIGTETANPAIGDIVILSWIKNGVAGSHVGLYITTRNNLLYVLGGNQNNEVDISGWKPADAISFRRISA